MLWKTSQRLLDFTPPGGPGLRGMVMGVLNLTPDSFSDGGRFWNPRDPAAFGPAIAHALQMEADGAEIIDIGAESTRPGSLPATEEEELERILPVVRALMGDGPTRLKRAVISVDTTKAAVARAALEAGAAIVNDITALRGDPAMAAVVAQSGAGVILMHMRGTPQTMQHAPRYDDVVAEVRAFFAERAAHALRSGIDPQQIAFDPGPGFGKTVAHNLALLRHLRGLSPGAAEVERELGGEWDAAWGAALQDRPMVWAVSRKNFIGRLIAGPGEPEDAAAFAAAVETRPPAPVGERDLPTVALTSLGRALGAHVFRVHDVRPNAQALRIAEAVLAG